MIDDYTAKWQYQLPHGRLVGTKATDLAFDEYELRIFYLSDEGLDSRQTLIYKESIRPAMLENYYTDIMKDFVVFFMTPLHQAPLYINDSKFDRSAILRLKLAV